MTRGIRIRRRARWITKSVMGALALANASNAFGQTTASWLLPVDGSWTDAAKWSTNPAVPNNSVGSSSYNVYFTATGAPHVVTFNGPVGMAVSNITIGSPDTRLEMISPPLTLTVSGGLAIDQGEFRFRGGTIQNANITTSPSGQFVIPANSSSVRLQGVTLGTDLQLLQVSTLSILSGLTLADAAIHITSTSGLGSGALVFSGTQAVVGSGEIVFDGNTDFGLLQGPVGSLSIGSGVTIRTGTSGGMIGTNTTFGIDYINAGTVSAQTAGKRLLVQGRSFTNNGTLRASNGGTLLLLTLSGNAGTLIPDGGTISLSGTYALNQPVDVSATSALVLGGTWTNAATINLTGGTLALGGTFNVNSIGQINRSGGTVALVGQLNNTGQTLQLDSATGDWWMAGPSATIFGGTISTSGGASLRVAPGTGPNKLSDVILAGDLLVQGSLFIDGALTLSGGSIVLNDGTLRTDTSFVDSGKILGSGSILLDGSGSSGITGVKMIGPGVIVEGSGGGVIEALGSSPGTNLGVIRSGSLGSAIRVAAPASIYTFTNAGLIEASGGGSLGLDGRWTNTGTILLNNGILNLSGTFSSAELGTFVRSGGTVNLNGVVENTGTIALDSNTGSWNIAGGTTLRGGTISSVGGGQFIPIGASTFENLAIRTDVSNHGSLLANSATLNLTGTMQNLGLITATNGSRINLSGSWSNAGTFRVENSTLNLGGTFATSSLGTIEQTNGTVNLTGVLDNTGNTLDLAGIGTVILFGGTIENGTITGQPGMHYLEFSSTGTLIGVQLASDARIRPNGILSAVNGLTLLGGSRILMNDVSSNSNGSVRIVGGGSINGDGEIVFNNSSSNVILATSGTATIGSGIRIRSGLGGGTLSSLGTTTGMVNQGVISSQLAGRYIGFDGNFTNLGLIEARDGGTINLNNNAKLTNYSGNVLTGGRWAAYSNSTISISSAAIATNNADILLDGPGSVFAASNPLVSNLGSFTIDHGRDFVTVGSLSTSGFLGVGTNSTLYVSGPLNNTGSIDLIGTIIVNYNPGDSESAIFDTLVGQIGSQIFTSQVDPAKGVGSAENSELGYVTFHGQPVDATSVLLMLTYFGDANLDGVADLGDFDRFLAGYGPADAASSWTAGDFDYSGIVDLTDFELYLNGYYALGGSMQAISNAVKSSGLPESDQSAMPLLVATVPEPLGAVSVGILIPWALFGRAQSRLKRPRRPKLREH